VENAVEVVRVAAILGGCESFGKKKKKKNGGMLENDG